MRKVILDNEYQERHPDDSKTDKMRSIERFLVEKHTDQKLQRGSNVLKQTDQRKRNLFRRRGKQEQWNRRHRAGTDQQSCNKGTVMRKSTRAIDFNKQKIEQGDRKYNS